MSNMDVSPTYLAAGAALGGVAGGLLGPSITGDSSVSSTMADASKLLSTFAGSSGVPEMKVGLPAF